VKAIYILLALVSISFLLAFSSREFFKPKPLVTISCPSGYEYMDAFSECSDTAYTKSGYSGCAWKTGDVPGCKYYNPICYKCSSTPCPNCGVKTTEPPKCPTTAGQWVREYIYCPSAGRCTENKVDVTLSCSTPACTDECSSGATKCENKKIYSCRNCDSDSCVEWCYDKDVQCCSNADCPSGYTCQNYSCVGATVSGTLNLIFQGILNLFRVRLI
jgi:hypothetical protein